jgi:hypothetical protein
VSWELSQLVHSYAARIDDRQPVVQLFTEEAVLLAPDPPDVLDPVREHAGRDAIAAATGALPPTFHAIVGEVYAVDGDRATGRIACVAHHVVDERTDLVWHLRYADSYRAQDGVWRFARRELSIDLIETRTLKRARMR